MASVALVDDHILLRNGLATLIETFPEFFVTLQAKNGKDFIQQLDPSNLPQIVLMDIEMGEMDGYVTTRWLRKNHPTIKVVALSMLQSEAAIIKMIKCGARGYLVKNADPSELHNALQKILKNDYYLNDLVNSHMVNNIISQVEIESDDRLTKPSQREANFLKLICSDLSYKEIANELNVSPRTVDGYRDNLFKKLEITTRVGLALYAIKNKYVELD
jgi:two-component system, NarL family, invasion response regulator UvrY